MSWQELMSGSPGTRFAQHYQRRHREGAGKLRSALSVLGGTFLIVIGLLLVVTPGPGVLLLVTGAAILATRSRVLAHVLDRSETSVRALLSQRNSHDHEEHDK